MTWPYIDWPLKKYDGLPFIKFEHLDRGAIAKVDRKHLDSFTHIQIEWNTMTKEYLCIWGYKDDEHFGKKLIFRPRKKKV